MKKILMVAATFFLIVLISNFASAYTITIEVQPSFSIGETISFNYVITSEQSAFTPVSYIATVLCPKLSIAPILEKTIIMKPFSSHSESYSYLVVDGRIEPQTCTASVHILGSSEVIEQKNFEIETSPSFEFILKTCNDSVCENKSKIFIKGKSVYFDFETNVENINLVTKLTFPDNTTQQIGLPTSIKAEQLGKYYFEATASKQGYKTITKKQQFSVIEKEAKLPFVVECNNNKICSQSENYKICPKDCPSGSSDKYCDKVSEGKCDPDCSEEEDTDCAKTLPVEINWFLIIASIAIIIAILVIIVVALFLKGKPAKNH